jgi:hypothetical protein
MVKACRMGKDGKKEEVTSRKEVEQLSGRIAYIKESTEGGS